MTSKSIFQLFQVSRVMDQCGLLRFLFCKSARHLHLLTLRGYKMYSHEIVNKTNYQLSRIETTLLSCRPLDWTFPVKQYLPGKSDSPVGLLQQMNCSFSRCKSNSLSLGWYFLWFFFSLHNLTNNFNVCFRKQPVHVEDYPTSIPKWCMVISKEANSFSTYSAILYHS
jgi:hypothetical protein